MRKKLLMIILSLLFVLTLFACEGVDIGAVTDGAAGVIDGSVEEGKDYDAILQEAKNSLTTIKAWLDVKIPSAVSSDIELPTTHPNRESKIAWKTERADILTTDGKFTASEVDTKFQLTAEITVYYESNATEKSKPLMQTWEKQITGLAEGIPDKVSAVMARLKVPFEKANVFNADVPSDYLPTSLSDYGAQIFWASENNLIIDGAGKYNMPQYTTSVNLIATIAIPGYKTYEYVIPIVAKGLMSIPEPATIRTYLTKLIGTEITSDLYLPGKYVEEGMYTATENLFVEEIKINWTVGGTNAPTDMIKNGQIRRGAWDVNVKLVASMTFQGKAFADTLDFDVCVKAVTEEEMYAYAKRFIQNKLVLNVSNGTEFPITDDRYGMGFAWESSDSNRATINNGVIAISKSAENMQSVVFGATVSKSGEQLGAKLNFNANIVSSTVKLNRGEEIDAVLFDALAQKLGIVGRTYLIPEDFNPANAANRVFTLDLSNKGLEKLNGIQYATDLRYLNISGNPLANEANNYTVDLSLVSSLKNLEVLIAKDCGITSLNAGGRSPLEAMRKLYALDLSDNKIADSGALFANNIYKDMKILYLANNHISDISSLNLLPNLTNLNLSGNEVTDINSLAGLKRLTFLTLDHNKINDISALSGLSSIRTLRLDYQKGGNKIESIAALAGMKAMVELYITANSVTELDALDDMNSLVKLFADDNAIYSYAGITLLKSLSYVRLENNELTTMPFFDSPHKIVELKLKNNKINATAAQFKMCISRLTNLAVFTISNKTGEGITLNSLDFLDSFIPAEGEPKLMHLELPNVAITPEYTVTEQDESGSKEVIYSMLKYLEKFTALKYLDLSNTGITDIRPLQALTNLVQLNLDGNEITENLYEEGGANIISGFNKLTVLSLENTGLESLYPNGIDMLTNKNKLVYLNLRGNSIAKLDFMSLVPAKNTLKYIYVDSPSIYETNGITYLKNFKVLKEISLYNAFFVGTEDERNKAFSELNSGVTYVNFSAAKGLLKAGLTEIKDVSALAELKYLMLDGQSQLTNLDNLSSIIGNLKVLTLNDISFDDLLAANDDGLDVLNSLSADARLYVTDCGIFSNRVLMALCSIYDTKAATANVYLYDIANPWTPNAEVEGAIIIDAFEAALNIENDSNLLINHELENEESIFDISNIESVLSNSFAEKYGYTFSWSITDDCVDRCGINDKIITFTELPKQGETYKVQYSFTLYQGRNEDEGVLISSKLNLQVANGCVYVQFDTNCDLEEENKVLFPNDELPSLEGKRTGWTFLGWYENESFEGTPITTVSTDFVSSLKVYAKWEAIIVTYNSITTTPDLSDALCASTVIIDWSNETSFSADSSHNSANRANPNQIKISGEAVETVRFIGAADKVFTNLVIITDSIRTKAVRVELENFSYYAPGGCHAMHSGVSLTIEVTGSCVIHAGSSGSAAYAGNIAVAANDLTVNLPKSDSILSLYGGNGYYGASAGGNAIYAKDFVFTLSGNGKMYCYGGVGGGGYNGENYTGGNGGKGGTGGIAVYVGSIVMNDAVSLTACGGDGGNGGTGGIGCTGYQGSRGFNQRDKEDGYNGGTGGDGGRGGRGGDGGEIGLACLYNSIQYDDTLQTLVVSNGFRGWGGVGGRGGTGGAGGDGEYTSWWAISISFVSSGGTGGRGGTGGNGGDGRGNSNGGDPGDGGRGGYAGCHNFVNSNNVVTKSVYGSPGAAGPSGYWGASGKAI